MKTLSLVAILVLGSFILSGQQVQGTDLVLLEVGITQDGFTEIPVEELPEPIGTALSKNYPTATIDKAFVNEAKQYKLEVSLRDGTKGTLYADENGNWIEL